MILSTFSPLLRSEIYENKNQDKVKLSIPNIIQYQKRCLVKVKKLFILLVTSSMRVFFC